MQILGVHGPWRAHWLIRQRKIIGCDHYVQDILLSRCLYFLLQSLYDTKSRSLLPILLPKARGKKKKREKERKFPENTEWACDQLCLSRYRSRSRPRPLWLTFKKDLGQGPGRLQPFVRLQGTRGTGGLFGIMRGRRGVVTVFDCWRTREEG